MCVIVSGTALWLVVSKLFSWRGGWRGFGACVSVSVFRGFVELVLFPFAL